MVAGYPASAQAARTEIQVRRPSLWDRVGTVSSPVLVYGAYGFTGELVARQAVERGLETIVAGRDPERLARVARALGCESRTFPLTDAEALRRGLRGAAGVVHCAGPFVETAEPMAEACIDERVHYLDVTGEIPAIAALHALGPAARDAGVMLLPAAGFDVVPSDCLAAHLARRLPSPRALTVTIGGLDEISRGTARTLLEQVRAAKRSGAPRPRTRTFDLGTGPVEGIEAPWVDPFTAPRSTGIAEVRAYAVGNVAMRATHRVLRRIAPLLERAWVRDALSTFLARGVPGPEADRRARQRTVVWCEVTDASGARAAAVQQLPDAYTFTALATAEIAARVVKRDAPPGWQTPSSAYGPDLVLAIPGVSRQDL